MVGCASYLVGIANLSMTKVYVGMSGGVDSSVTAALLVEAGYDVTGVYMKNWSRDLPGARCPWAEDLADARRVAVGLGIDLKIYDFEAEYKQKVVDYMLAEYQAGRTPNPDIMCNQEIKFKLFLETAMGDGADMIATGHYARTNKTQLLRAKDDKKDQTYFLYRVTKEALEKTLFPLGELLKSQVRKLAHERGLATANKKDSVGICFVGQVGIEEFLSQYIDIKPGRIIERESSKELGWHNGAIFYTIGQRHGLNLGGGLPYYVVGKNIDKNEVYVSRDLNQLDLWIEKIILKDLHWINQAPDINKVYQIRTRHQAPLVEAQIKDYNTQRLVLNLDSPQRAITSGQSVVFYDGSVCLGGGIVAD